MKKHVFALLVILAVAAFLRLYHLGQHDVINDEVFYGYRGIGLVDSVNSDYQPTPFETADPIPFWMRLSFHDHPPLGFWIEHLFFKIFGVNLWGLRLPFALAGIASVYLVYLIAKILFTSENRGLLAAAVLAVNNYPTWVSRLALQESLVIFFVLLAVWLMLKCFENSRYFYPAVAAIGAAVLTKYTALILLPLFAGWILWKHRGLLTWRRMIFGGLLFVGILSPVIIYNHRLYQTTGHLDFQLSFLLKQDAPEWQVRPGREVGGALQKAKNFFARFYAGFGPVFSLMSLIALGFAVLRRRERAVQFLLFFLALLLMLFAVMGPGQRFLVMLAPVLALLAAWVFGRISRRKIFGTLFILFLAFELFFTANTNLARVPRGPLNVAYSKLRFDENLWGYNQLEDYFQKEMAGRYVPGNFPLRYKFAEKLAHEASQQTKERDYEPYQILFVFDTTVDGEAALWYITRHIVYDGWAFLDDHTYLAAIATDSEVFSKQGFVKTVFIKAADTLRRDDVSDAAAIELERLLSERSVPAKEIKSLTGRTAFRLYEF